MKIETTDLGAIARSEFLRQSVPAAATVRELCEFFGMNRDSISKIFETALVSRGKPNFYSRDSVADLISVKNGRVIPYPSERLLTQSEAAEFLAEQGRKFGVKSLERGRCRAYGPLFIKIGFRTVRYQIADLLDFIKGPGGS